MEAEPIVITSADHAEQTPRPFARRANGVYLALFCALALHVCVSGQVWTQPTAAMLLVLFVIVPANILYALAGLLIVELAVLWMARRAAMRFPWLPASFRVARAPAIPFAPRLRLRRWMWMVIAVAVLGLTASREGLLSDALTLELTLDHDLGTRYLFTPTSFELEEREDLRVLSGSYVECDVRCTEDGALCDGFRRSFSCDDDRRPPHAGERVTQIDLRVRHDGGSCWPIPLLKAGGMDLDWGAVLRAEDGSVYTIEGRGHVDQGLIVGIRSCRSVRRKLGRRGALEIARILQTAMNGQPSSQ